MAYRIFCNTPGEKGRTDGVQGRRLFRGGGNPSSVEVIQKHLPLGAYFQSYLNNNWSILHYSLVCILHIYHWVDILKLQNKQVGRFPIEANVVVIPGRLNIGRLQAGIASTSVIMAAIFLCDFCSHSHTHLSLRTNVSH